MFTLRKVVPVLCIAASLSGLAAYAATTTPATETAEHRRAATGMDVITRIHGHGHAQAQPDGRSEGAGQDDHGR